MALSKTKIILVTVSILILAFLALRVYGAYQQERDDALEQAATGDQKAKELELESNRLKAQSDCNLLWTKYENARLEKQIAQLRGTFAPTPVEPSCTGYAARLDSALDLNMRQMQVTFAQLEAAEYARYERDYAASRKFQTRYLLIRIWASLTGTKPKVKQAEMAAQLEKAEMLESCRTKAKNDSDRKDCEKMFGNQK